MNLFRSGIFTLNSGQTSNYKIDCDALCYDDWFTLAQLIRERVPAFYDAEGIPRGGLQLANILHQYRSGNPEDPILVVDDVYTTGGSFRRHVENREGEFIGAVVFARNPVIDEWVIPLLTIH